MAPSSSVTMTESVVSVGPLGKTQANEPPVASRASEPATFVAPVPHDVAAATIVSPAPASLNV